MEKFWDRAGIRTQDLLNTYQSDALTTKTFEHLGSGAEDKLQEQHCLKASAEFQLILTLSRVN